MRFTPPSSRQGGNQAWDACVLCGSNRLWPESALGEYEGKKYCNAHLTAKLANEIDPSTINLTEETAD